MVQEESVFKQIAERRAGKMKQYGVDWERSKLKRHGWTIKEISKIIKLEREIIKNERTKT